MDVRCSTCGEPWDTHHLWHDEIYEVARSSMEAETWLDLPSHQRLMEPYRTLFRQAGWEFGATVHTSPCDPLHIRVVALAEKRASRRSSR